MAKTTQATRNIRKFSKHQTHGVKGRMITDDYGNRYSVTNDPKAKVARRHTLSRGKKRAISLKTSSKDSNRHYISASRRSKLHDMLPYNKDETHHLRKVAYHTRRQESTASPRGKINDMNATAHAKIIHGTKRKPKDFTK